MSYQVIARKYRPQRFADVVGQEHVTQTLANAVKQNRIAHAYLFCGPRGTGKTTIARIFAKCLNCTGGPKVDFDDADQRCQEIADGRSLDVLEIDGASNNGVEQVRELRETCKYAPASSKFKIYIIDEVHMLSTAAFNALLKTLEEPPAHVKFLFATTDPEKVLPTILSRCQRFDLRRIPTALIVEHLKKIAKQESVDIDEAALFAIARGAEGGLRDAESTLDQLISFCGNKIVESDVLSMFGLTSQNQIIELTQAIMDANSEQALRILDGLSKHGKDLGRLVADLLNEFRNLLVFQVSKGDLKLLEVSEAEAAAISKQAGKIGVDVLTRIMEVLTDAETRLRDAASKKTLIEVTLLKAIEARNAVSIDAVLKHLQQLRSGEGGGPAPKAAAPRVTEKPAPVAPVKKSTPQILQETAPGAPASKPAYDVRPQKAGLETGAPTATTDLVNLWHRLLEAVGHVSQFTRTYLLEAHPVCLEKNVLTIGFDPEFGDHLALVDNAKNHTMISTKLHELGCGHCQVKFIQAEAPEHWVKPAAQAAPEPVPAAAQPAVAAAPAARPASAPAPSKAKHEPVLLNKEDFKNDPLIKKALELFKGQIVEVRA